MTVIEARRLARLSMGTRSLAVLACLLVASGCTSSSTSTTNVEPSVVKCQVSLSMAPASIAAGGGSGGISVATQAECAWTATSSANWISGINPASGQGNGQVQFNVGANSDPVVRQADITINGEAAHVRQDAAQCTIDISPRSQTVDVAGGAVTVSVTTASACSWTVNSTVNWISVSSAASGTGNASVRLSVSANTDEGRSGAVTIGGQTFTVTQAGPSTPPPAPPPPTTCSGTLAASSQSFSASGGPSTIAVQASGDCAWTAVSQASWITVTAGSTGRGNGAVSFLVAANTGSSSRTGSLVIANQTFTVAQAGVTLCTYTLNPTSRSIAAGGGSSNFSVNAGTGCSWTATSGVSWVTINAGANGTGNGTVTISVAANTGPARNGTVTAGGQTFTAAQASGCSYTINPTSRNVSAAATTGTVAVTTTAGCTWTAVSGASWLTVTSGAAGTGNGTVGYSVQANSGNNRNGTITIAGRTFTVSQEKN